MVMRMTSTEAVIIQAVLPLSILGGSGAGVAAAGAAAGVASAPAAGCEAAGSSARAGTARPSEAHRVSNNRNFLIGLSLNSSKRFCTRLACADPDGLFEWVHEDLAVADLPGVGGLLD